MKKLHARMIIHGMKPYSPCKQIDTLKIAKRKFAFTCNRLDYLAQKLCGFGKTPTNHALWQKCIAGNLEAFDDMLQYNINDIDLLEAVYFVLRPWDHLHPSFITATDTDEVVCNICGSGVEKTGYTVKTNVSVFTGWRCKNDKCGHQMRDRKSLRIKRPPALVNAT